MPELRFHIAELADGRLLAQDKSAGRVSLLTAKPASGEYRLSGGGVLTLKRGQVVSVSKPAASTGYILVAMGDGSVRVSRSNNYSWAFMIRRPGAPPAIDRSGTFAILELQTRGLLLARPDGVSELLAMPAPDGNYRTSTGAMLSIQAGQMHGSSGSPIYQYADDFAP